MKIRNKLISVSLLALTACNLAPDFELPQLSTPANFKETTLAQRKVEGSWKKAKAADTVEKGQWWKIFGDEELNKLQEQMLANNNDLQAAEARMRQFAAQADFASGELLPLVTGTAGMNRQRPSQNTVAGGFGPKVYNTYNLGAAVSYELDLFGSVRNNVYATEKDFESSEAAYQNIMLLLQADLAQVYFTLKATDEELKLVRNSLKYREEQNEIIRKREELGASSGLDLKQSDVQIANIRLEALELDKQRARYEHALAVLIGKAPSELNMAKTGFEFQQIEVPVGIPSEVLQRRPDVSGAVRDLEAANARIGIAKASFFPDISLTGSFGYSSMALSDLFKWSSHTWVLGPASGIIADMVLFDGGRYDARVENAEAAYKEVSANYKKTVLNAFKEVEDNLSDIKYLNEQLMQAELSYRSSVEVEQMTKLKYDEGATSYFELKDAELAAITSGQQQIRTQLQSTLATVNLIKSLGGGWNDVKEQIVNKSAE